jgi:sulfur-carrier protein
VIRVLYFARFRQIVGRPEDTINPPLHVDTVNRLIDHLIAADAGCAAAFADRRVIRAAINQSHVQLDTPLDGATEVALFPPVTGG